VALADARDGRHLWGISVEKPAREIVTVQAQLAADLGRELTRRLTGGQVQRLARPPTEDHEAYLLFLKGRYYWAKRDRESLLKGVDLFHQALDHDPNYARAWTGLAESYDVLTFLHYAPPKETFPKADEAARRATELDPSLGDAWAVLAHVTMLWKHDLPAAEAAFKKAIALNPSSFNAHHWYAHLLMSTNRWDEAEKESRTALDVDPLSLVASVHMGELLFARGDVEAAVVQFKKTIEMDPTFGIAHSFLGSALVSAGRYEAAITELREAARLLPDSADVLGQLGSALARSGHRAEAEAVLATLTEMRSRSYVSRRSSAR
jgi:tetratricopeptide (TPR) repeat protein